MCIKKPRYPNIIYFVSLDMLFTTTNNGKLNLFIISIKSVSRSNILKFHIFSFELTPS